LQQQRPHLQVDLRGGQGVQGLVDGTSAFGLCQGGGLFRLGLDGQRLGAVHGSFFLCTGRYLHRDGALFGFLGGLDQLDALVAFGHGHLTGGVHGFFSFHSLGLGQVGGCVRIRLFTRLGGNGDLRILAGNLDLLALFCALHLGLALQLDLARLNDQVFLQLGCLDFALGFDALLADLALGLDLGGFGLTGALSLL